jgi:hypothetical protein
MECGKQNGESSGQHHDDVKTVKGLHTGDLSPPHDDATKVRKLD